MKVVLEAENGQDLLDKIRASDELPDVLLLDLKMPVMGGIEAAEVIRREFPSILIVVISSHFSKAFIINMIEIGASAYLGKNTAPDEVVETIRMVREKGFYYNTSVMAIIRENIMAPMQGKYSRDLQVEITNREKEVLQLICEEYTTQEIADRLFLSVRTVDGHRNNLLSKLGCRNTAGLVVYALQNGLVKIRE
jgi:DNA-binding NarL/FixJ family response regulator